MGYEYAEGKHIGFTLLDFAQSVDKSASCSTCVMEGTTPAGFGEFSRASLSENESYCFSFENV